MSTGNLTGYDNTDANTGKADAEVYLYSAGAGELSCLSCNPSRGRPVGSVFKESVGGATWPTAARIPTWESQLYPPRVISESGRRVFFDSYEALVSRDTNGVEDLYEWEAAGEGDCTEGDQSFQQSSNGCLSLISSGESPQGSELLDSSITGEDVFFKTTSKLVPQDPGLLDIYDARVGGGFPPPQQPPPECEGEACQSPASAPEDQTPSSSNFLGPGNPTKKQKPHRCPKGKHKVQRKGKVRCTKKEPKHQSRRVVR